MAAQYQVVAWSHQFQEWLRAVIGDWQTCYTEAEKCAAAYPGDLVLGSYGPFATWDDVETGRKVIFILPASYDGKVFAVRAQMVAHQDMDEQPPQSAMTLDEAREILG